MGCSTGASSASGARRIEPDLALGEIQHHRQAMVNGSHDGVGRSRDDCAGFQLRAIRCAPTFPEPGKTKRPFVLALKKPRLAGLALTFPLIEATGGDHAAP